TVGDTPAEISNTLLRAIKRSDFIIVTGGLGSTTDDLTSEAVGQALARPPVFRPEIFAKIKARHNKADAQTLATLQKLAVLPTGAEVLNTEARMAGYLLEHDTKLVFFLPGIPHEMQELLVDKVIPRLDQCCGGPAKSVKQRVYKIFGLGESEVNRRVLHLEKQESEKIRIGYYPVFPEVHLSIAVIAAGKAEMNSIFENIEDEIKTALEGYLFGIDDDTMAGKVGELLQKQGKMLATAESCSGGLIGHKITAVPGSSNYFAGGVIAYSNDLKEKFLGIDPELISVEGAVSSAVAIKMADNIRAMTAAEVGLSVTGIAGPSGGTREKPVGTVFIGLSTTDKTIAVPCRFAGKRWQVQELTAVTALDLVRRLLLEKNT
ncbi:MAG: CinA family nicotinamide mononucleotide deamidase-related protein, partial [Desulfobulbales bacterium]|nr:CinA family nicotinamide mononucleotide deamidase-related protein [Desulfobulbales bacterium]